MYQRDYILRMIEMIGDLIASILGLIRNKDFTQAEEKLEGLYYSMLREDSSFFRNIPLENLTETLLLEHNYTNSHLEIIAELFNAEAELRLAKDDRQGCLEFSGKSLRLFEYIDLIQKTYIPERILKMELIRKRIEELTK